MTMRISIDIVPYGVEEDTYPIYRLDVHNIGLVEDLGFGHKICDYKVELQKKIGTQDWQKEGETFVRRHDRRDGSILLARRALEKFEEEWT